MPEKDARTRGKHHPRVLCASALLQLQPVAESVTDFPSQRQIGVVHRIKGDRPQLGRVDLPVRQVGIGQVQRGHVGTGAARKQGPCG